MNGVFADTSYYLALLSASDQFHAAAVEQYQHLDRVVIVTEFVLLELGNSLSRIGWREHFAELISQLRDDRKVKIVAASRPLFQKSSELFASRLDKEWSMVDCSSFVTMDEYGLADALSSDHHFEQAGFTILLK